MICIVINGPSYEQAHQQIEQALHTADLVELRLDHFTEVNLKALKELRAHFSIPMLFTLRSLSQGGTYKQSEAHRLATIRDFAALKPEYLDLEYDVPADFIQDITSQHPEIKLILSSHHFVDTPNDGELKALYRKMQEMPVAFYKIAVTPHNCLDAMRFLCWVKRSSKGHLIAISMGPHGQISRILGSLFNSPITYAALEEEQQSAPGQLSAQTLIERYHHYSLTPRTKIYGLIGDPVDRSLSHQTHNTLIKASKLDAVYIKIQVKESELSNFFYFVKQLPFGGLSVTMPLKEAVLSHLDQIDPTAKKVGAVNTLLFDQGKLIGFNTDGIGALNALEREGSIQDKRMIIIGAGGAAKAIAFEAKQRGACVTILNRNAERSRQLGKSLHCDAGGLDLMPECAKVGYDILVNCTPVPTPIDARDLLPNIVFMDIVNRPKDMTFQEFALKKGCTVIPGYHMFVEQAVEQFTIWFGDPQQASQRREVLKRPCCIIHHRELQADQSQFSDEFGY